jgi:hypothetical protein
MLAVNAESRNQQIRDVGVLTRPCQLGGTAKTDVYHFADTCCPEPFYELLKRFFRKFHSINCFHGYFLDEDILRG